MRFAVHYTNLFRYYDEIDEVLFDFKDINRDQIINFIPTIIKKDSQKIIINISTVDNENIPDIIPYLVKLKSIHSNLLIQIDLIEQKKFIPLLQDNELKYMFINYCNNYETFYSMIKLGAEDIYIVEALAFDLKSLQSIRRKKGINLRIIPDIAQSTIGTRTAISDFTKFWVRPEDVEIYENYVDVFEFVHINEQQSVIYEIYKQQQWLGNLNDIILDFDLNINNTAIDPRFGINRVDCRKKCMIGKCDLCKVFYDFAIKLDAAGIEIIKKKKKFEITEQEKEEVLKALEK